MDIDYRFDTVTSYSKPCW